MRKKTKKIITVSSVIALEVLTVIITAKIAKGQGYDKGVFDVLSARVDNPRM